MSMGTVRITIPCSPEVWAQAELMIVGLQLPLSMVLNGPNAEISGPLIDVMLAGWAVELASRKW
jgi:hypothetical protein